MDFYAYHFMLRKDNYCTIQRRRILFRQFVVDMYAKIETDHLLFIRFNRQKLLVDGYIHLRDGIAADGTGNILGVINPAFFLHWKSAATCTRERRMQ